MNSFHNTIGLEGKDLIKHEGKAIKLEIRILSWLEQRQGKKYTPIEINEQCCPNDLLTSVRRALSNLVKEEKLKDTRFTNEKKMEKYGAPNYLWYYPLPVNNNGQLELTLK